MQDDARATAGTDGADARTSDRIVAAPAIDAILIATSIEIPAVSNFRARGTVSDAEEGWKVGTTHHHILEPAPPPVGNFEVSNGRIRGRIVHHLDLATFLMGDRPKVVSGSASCLVDPEIGAGYRAPPRAAHILWITTPNTQYRQPTR